MTRSITRRSFVRATAGTIGGAALAGKLAAPAVIRAADNGGKIRAYWNAGHAYDTYKQVIDQFKKDHPGWDVSLELYQWPDLRTKLLADFAAGNPPDLVEEPGGWAQEFGLAGYLQPLDPFIAKSGAEMGFPEDWQPYTVERQQVDGKTYGVQLHLTCNLLFYNTKMLSDAGISKPPATWDEFLAAAKATSKGGVFGYAPNQDTGYMWTWFLQNGVKYYDPATKQLGFDNPDAFAALQFVADMIHKDKVAPVPVTSADYEGPQKLFSAKRAAMILTGPWDIKPILSGTPDLEWGIAQALTGKVKATYAAGTSLLIPKDAKQADLAWDLITRLTKLDVEIAATKEANMTMPRKSWASAPEIQKLERIAPFGEGLGYAQDVNAQIRLTGKFGQIDPLLQKAIQDVIYKSTPASEALKDLNDKGNKILNG